jgi:hypothetical protein
MGIGGGRLALCSPLPTSPPASGTGLTSASLMEVAPQPSGWWDASTKSALLGATGTPIAAWNSPGASLVDLSGNEQNLRPFFVRPGSVSPQSVPHLCGLLGGAGYPTGNTALLQPALDADAGWTAATSIVSSASSWAWVLVWSRPNRRQGSGQDTQPITLLTSGSTPVLQIDSQGSTNRLVLFPGTPGIVLSSSMARRHSHSIVIRYSPAAGTDVWLDDVAVAQGVPWPPAASSGTVVLLHDTTNFGSAQCWLHEAANWARSLLSSEVAALLSYLDRWPRGDRQGIFLLINGQSNAINYSLVDGAAALLAQGVAWHTGALACNVLATQGNSSSYTMQSGHGIYTVANSGYPYPGSFVADPGDGSSPSAWALGADGVAVETALSSLTAEDRSDIRAIVWPWSETDSLRQYGELATFQAAATRFISQLRAMIGDVTSQIPVVWWNAIPYGPAAGMTMHRQVVRSMADTPGLGVIIGNLQTSDSNARGSSWDPATGLSTGGDSAHRDSADNLRFAILASPIIARGVTSGDTFDASLAIPDALPKAGGPRITNAYRQSPSTLIITVLHDAGTDLTLPRQAAAGVGFSVMDGGSITAPGTIVTAVSCQRLDATHLQIELSQALRSVSAQCALYYPYGNGQIGRGNAVTDNFSSLPRPSGWDASSDLGPQWAVDCPLSATFGGIVLSDVYV